MPTNVTVEINQQQRQLVDRLIADGSYGDTPAEVISRAFADFVARHPELAAEGGRKD